MLDSIIVLSDVSLFLSLFSVLQQLRTSKSAKGISLLSLSTIVFARTLHSLSHPLFGLHYRPQVLPTVLYLFLDILNASLGMFTVALFVKYWSSYEVEKDNFCAPLIRKVFNKDSTITHWVFFGSTIVVFSFGWYYFRRYKNQDFSTAMFCSSYEVLGFLALLPQLWMFQSEKVVSQALGNFIGFTALHRLLTLSFWLFFPLVHTHRVLDNRMIQMSSEVINLLIIADFLYYYVRSYVRGEKEIVILHDDVV